MRHQLKLFYLLLVVVLAVGLAGCLTNSAPNRWLNFAGLSALLTGVGWLVRAVAVHNRREEIRNRRACGLPFRRALRAIAAEWNDD